MYGRNMWKETRKTKTVQQERKEQRGEKREKRDDKKRENNITREITYLNLIRL